MITQTFTGSPDEVEIQIVRYFSSYNPSGYDTKIVSDKTENGIRTVRITRYSSCD